MRRSALPRRMKPLFWLVLCALVASGAAAQSAGADAPPLPAEIQGAWEMVEAPDYGHDVTVHQMTLIVSGHRVTQRDVFTAGGESVERAFTATCLVVDGVIGCLPSDEGTRTGHGGLGRYEVLGDRLVFTDPDSGARIVFRRVGG